MSEYEPSAVNIDADQIRQRVRSPLWRDISAVPETGSTNADLAAEARTGVESGRVLISESQTAGRGRFDRKWETPAGAAIGMSVLLRPTQAMPAWGWLSLVAGMAVAQGIRDATGVAPHRVQLKWPNDVLIDGLKVCGILAERVESSDAALRPAAVIGMGINIALTHDQLPVPNATSLRLSGLSEDANSLVVAVLDRLATWYAEWDAEGQLRAEYRDQCASIGKRLRVHESVVPGQPGASVEGVGIDVDAQGRLVVRLDNGSTRSFWAGDVHHLR